jgi:GNAT superfamily N-acetyltransferase
MIEPVVDIDLPKLRYVTAAAVRESIVESENAAAFLIADIDRGLESWLANPDDALHLKYRTDGEIVGYILVREFWNISHLFVLPRYQRRGIGTALLRAAIENCRAKSPRKKLQLNSSTNAVPFYTSMGFRQTGPGVDRPGGRVPFEYCF